MLREMPTNYIKHVILAEAQHQRVTGASGLHPLLGLED